MPDQTNSAGRPAQEPRETVRIHTSQISDACIDKDCIEDLQVYLTASSQAALESAVNARARSAELLHAYIDVAPIAYNPGRFTADLSFFYRITGEAASGIARPAPLEGLAVFNKRVVLFGGLFISANLRKRAFRCHHLPPVCAHFPPFGGRFYG